MVQYLASRMAASLYVVSTPIGNLDDITLRALKVLKEVALIAAEDTRRTAILLRHYGIATLSTSFHQHNERRKAPVLLAALARGESVALVSDAGTPVVSDPGLHLVDAALRQGVSVVAIPGASAVMAALVTSGFPGDSFRFLGFAPSRSIDRKQWFRELAMEARTTIFFEAPHRIRATLEEIANVLGERPIALNRELTKIHEEVHRGPASAVLRQLSTTKGEFSIVLAPLPSAKSVQRLASDEQISDYFHQMTNSVGAARRSAIAATAKHFGMSAKSVYSIVEKLKAMRSS